MHESEVSTYEAISPIDLEKVDTIIHNYCYDRSSLIAILQDTQSEYGYLPQIVLWHISEKLHVPFIQILGVATFFKAFRLTPRGQHIIQVCLGTACHVKSAPRLLEEIERRLSLDTCGTTADGLFTLETVNCLGCCALGPVIRIDDKYFGEMTATKIARQLKKLTKDHKV